MGQRRTPSLPVSRSSSGSAKPLAELERVEQHRVGCLTAGRAGSLGQKEDDVALATTWGTGQVLLDILWFFLLFIEIWLMISIFIDLFRRKDMKGWQKALWVIGIILVPLIGILVYLVIYGNEMKVHALQEDQQNEQAVRNYIRWAAGSSSSPADELTRLADLRDRGVITEDEFQKLKDRIVHAGA